ncbi:transcriptional regulator [Bacillus cereus]|uniref:helix-turn-helix transcriptional regulator n=1 Tax=Bacillus TaxID=1386 RepID=UPI000BF799A0|nr:helix-turn-helix transcriptional regulator [Bacillus paranthracis]PFN28861.1 transcriptional regulator [Bacillus cereus]MDF9513204.1 helix-turn-helix transcriptional regulator [Bacillus paranthracis]MDF9672218.1 helix-turn-helix transcriptional regulator [Bacillus paranthracis]MDG1611975.1 helix-turn-helix transcriptional regulator [Bacillus paranthracis]NMW17223.1 helix-turn-helix transcriptional regulator [Bacillus paranthracis]
MKIYLKDIKEFNILLIKKGFNKSSLAKETQVSKSSIANISKGTRHPSPLVAKKITDALEIDFDEIFQIRFHEKEVI